MKFIKKSLTLVSALLLMFNTSALAQNQSHNEKGGAIPDTNIAKEVLIKNVSIFNGTSEKLITGKDVVLLGNKIHKIIPSGGEESEYHQVIDGKGGYLTPGIIDAHIHAFMGSNPEKTFNQPFILTTYVTGQEMGEMLMRGVTTARDMAGPTVPLRMAIDNGNIIGPRMYSAGAMISSYSGHMDYRNPNHLNRELGGEKASDIEMHGIGYLANGPVQVRTAARQQLALGANCIKLSTTGSITGVDDPIDVVEFSYEEIKAAVDVAKDFGTYVAVHAYNDEGVKRALDAGVLSFEHGNLMSEESMKRIAEVGAFWVPQIWADHDYIKQGLTKALVVEKGTGNAMAYAKKYKVKIAYGTDLLFNIESRKTQLQELVSRKEYFTSAEIMIQATGNGGELVAMSGKRNPYGVLGVIEEGAMADILIYSKNPMEDVAIVADFENNLKLIIKDGKVYKNTLN